MLTLVWLGVVVAGFFALAYGNAAGWLWTGAIAAALAAAWGAHLMPLLVVIVLAGLLVVLAISLNFPPLRRALISDGVLAVFRRILPPMTPTEREAIEAGTVGWDAELFSGRPDWGKLLALPAPKLTAEEQH
ncbi:MAG: acyl-CoA dehydrogenase, partial [Betaproteobacteria bacterium]